MATEVTRPALGASTSAAPAPITAPPISAAPAVAAVTPVFATPVARKLAREHGVDLMTLRTTVGGRVHKQHILDAVAAESSASIAAARPNSIPRPRSPVRSRSRSAVPPATVAEPQSTGQPSSAPRPATLDVSTTLPVPAAPQASAVPGKLARLLDRTEKLSRLRRVVAARMVESLRVSAQSTMVVEVDVTEIARLRARYQDGFAEREGVELTYLPFVAKAAIEALKVYPRLNSSLDPGAGTVTYHGAAHLGLAVDTDRRPIVPVIADAGDLGIAGLARRIADVAERIRANKISAVELSGGTFTITNTGAAGALFDTPIINQPQVAILGIGAVVKRAVVVTDSIGGDSIAVRSMVYLALTYDHRIVDSADAARFLTAVRKRLEAAAFESDLG